jgi:hypothetical protein
MTDKRSVFRKVSPLITAHERRVDRLTRTTSSLVPNGNTLPLGVCKRIVGARHAKVRISPIAASGEPLPPGNIAPPQSKMIMHSDRPRYTKTGGPWEGGYSILFATPHPHRDIPRLRPSYEHVPNWLWATEEFLDEAASAVVLTHPPDVEAVQNLLLRVIGFPKPYTVLPVYGSSGTNIIHDEVMVIARRPKPAPPADCFPITRGELQSPAVIARKLQPLAERVLRLFTPSDRLLFDSGVHAWEPFERRYGERGTWPASASPSCWKPWNYGEI